MAGETGVNVEGQLQAALSERFSGGTVKVSGGGGGHFAIEVISPLFEGKSRLECQRMVLSAIKHLMAGDAAPVHAVDSIVARAT